jgi:hypothetical protein
LEKARSEAEDDGVPTWRGGLGDTCATVKVVIAPSPPLLTAVPDEARVVVGRHLSGGIRGERIPVGLVREGEQ